MNTTKTSFQTLRRLALGLLMLLPGTPLALTAQVADSAVLTNLVIFLRFADDEEIDYPFDSIDRMFNSREEGYLSVYNYFDATTYGRIRYRTVYPSSCAGGQIVSYTDIHPRGYFEPYSDSNTIGYISNPHVGISMREAQLLARALRHVDSLHLVPDSVSLDGNGDGYIDNVSFIIKGSTGNWADLLWPHMEYFPHDSIDHPVTVNGVLPNTFNFELEGAGDYLFSADVFRHEMGHSLGLPDLYHYEHYTTVYPAAYWDQMCHTAPGGNQISAILKSKILHVCDEPIEITADGDYTLLSVGSSPVQNCYFIRSATDSGQWFTFEYRRQADPFEAGLPGTGLIAGRWVDTVPLTYDGMFANSFFDFYNQAHQYWIFRPGSDVDTVGGSVLSAHFSQADGRTAFGPDTDPHPYLTDGTPERSFEITGIREQGERLTFHVRFLGRQSAIAPEAAAPTLIVRQGRIVALGMEHAPLRVFDALGRQVPNRGLPSGVYIVRLDGCPAQKVVVL